MELEESLQKIFQFLKKADRNFITSDDLKNMFMTAFQSFSQYINITNAVNVFPVPDGDTGINVFETLKSINNELKQIGECNHCGKIISIISHGAFNGCVGNSGIILSEYFHGLEEVWRDKRELSGKDFALGLFNGAKFAYSSIDDPRDGTILSVQKSIGKKAKEIAERYNNPFIVLLESFQESKKALKDTYYLLPELRIAGTIDAGALAFVLILEGFIESIFEEEIFSSSYTRTIDKELEPFLKLEPKVLEGGIEQEWEIQFNIESLKKSIENLKSQLKKEGESLLISYDSQSPDIRVHIHIRQPVNVFLKKVEILVGKLKNITIMDLKGQHNEFKQTLIDKEGT